MEGILVLGFVPQDSIADIADHIGSDYLLDHPQTSKSRNIRLKTQHAV